MENKNLKSDEIENESVRSAQADSYKQMDEDAEKLKLHEKRKKKIIRKRRRQKVWCGLLIFVLVIYMVIGVVGLNFLSKNIETIPDLNVKDLLSQESSKIYDANGNLVTEIGTYYRENIKYDQCPESLVDAFLSIEDSRFFQHNGFDVPRFTKAALETVAGKDGGGGSTFTMQLIKNSYFSIDAGDNSVERQATIEYKIQQIMLSMELEQELSKQEIFELYMNKLNFGDRIRGAQKAAEYYFGKSAGEMSLTESALLAGIINLPNSYNPYHHLDWATERRNDVLRLMLQHGYINRKQYDLAISIRVEDLLVGADKLNTENTKYAQYIDVVIDEAINMTGRDPVLYGMDIYTALQPDIQQKIEDIENGNTSVRFADDLMQTSIISMNNQNGEIVGVGGGRNYQGGARLLNRATDQYKQPGSSVKPVLEYALGFEYLGYSLDEILMDKPITFPGESRVLVNAAGHGYEGDVTIKDALAKSLNIPAIQTLEKATARIGQDAVIDYLHGLGFSHATSSNFHMSYAIGGNAFETTVKELAGAHAAMINHGIYNTPHTIRKIVTTDGEIYYPANQNQQILSSGSAWLVDQLMKNNVDEGNRLYNYMGILQRSYPVYAKTGTTDWGSDGLQYGIPFGSMKDKWMVSSTAKYTNAVWVGYDKAIAWAGTYFSQWKAYMNIPGKINSELINIEEDVSGNPGEVTQPADIMAVTYANGTWPHVSYGNNMITSLVSSTGYSNTPSVDQTGVLTNFSASFNNNVLIIDWGAKKGCWQGTQDISLHDYWNDEPATGACLVSTAWAYGTNPVFLAEIYQDDQYVTTVTSKDGLYGGYPAQLDSGVIKVCGWYSDGRTSSNQMCTIAYNFNTNSKSE